MKSEFLLALAACFLQASFSLKIASFNIARFGISKVEDPDVLSLLIRILRRYELISVQEVMSKDDTAIIRLVEELNAATGLNYNVLISDHLGRSSYREKYVYIYREDILKPTEWYHYEDGCENCGTDVFIREPFVARFSSVTTAEKNVRADALSRYIIPPSRLSSLNATRLHKVPARRSFVPQRLRKKILKWGHASCSAGHPGVAELKDFALVSIHTSPDYAVREVDALYDVWEDAKQNLLLEDILILGDYNAGCSYVKSSHWPEIRLRQEDGLQWLVGDSEDTTVSTNTHCPYDRLVVGGAQFQKAVIPGSAKAFNYHAAYGLTYDMAKAVSDHYPVEMELRNDSLYNNQKFTINSSIGISGGRSLNGVCDCVGVDFTSCVGRCGANSSSFPCNCNASCGDSNKCCADYRASCKG